jgi:hypothetical protein
MKGKEALPESPNQDQDTPQVPGLTELGAGLNQLQDLLADQAARIESLEAVLEEMIAAKEEKAKSPATQPERLKGTEFKVAGKTYTLKFPSFSYEGVEYNEESLLADKELLTKLAKEGSKLLVEK